MANSEVTIEQLTDCRLTHDCMLVDIRPIAAYNGWTLDGEPRGGHIPGAIAFPSEWTKYPEWLDILKSKGVTPDRKVILYGYDSSDIQAMFARLTNAGYADVHSFNRFREWAADKKLSFDHLPRYDRLVYPQWLNDLMSGEKPPQYDGRPFVVCHASFNNRLDYEDGHIPGSVFVDTLMLEDPETWNRRTPEELYRTFEELGIRHDTTVVVYGRDTMADPEDPYPGRYAGRLAAMRTAQIMMYAGVEDVRILNGGLGAWETAGYDITKEETVLHPISEFGANIPVRPELIVDTPEAKRLLASENGALVSVRSWNEWIGDVSGYNYIGKAGRIPGAVFGNCGSDAYHMENYRNVDHTMRSYHEVEAIWAKSGIVPAKHVAFYCGTGWRGSEALFHAYLMAWPRVAVYDGGWFEWSADPSNPVEVGEPVK